MLNKGEPGFERFKARISKKTGGAKNLGPHTAEQAVADQIWQYFGKKPKSDPLGFPALMGMIGRIGRQAVYEIWNGIRHSDPRNRESLFLHKVGESRIVWKK